MGPRARRQELAERYRTPAGERQASPGRGIHHGALNCADVELTIAFCQGLLGFPLVELVENRGCRGSSHLFFDVGNSTLRGFFDFMAAHHARKAFSLVTACHSSGLPPLEKSTMQSGRESSGRLAPVAPRWFPCWQQYRTTMYLTGLDDAAGANIAKQIRD